MKLCDLHCDTPFEIYKRKSSVLNGDTAFTLDKCRGYDSVCQVMAFWSDSKRTPDECYGDFLSMFGYLSDEIDAAREKMLVDGIDFDKRFTLIPAVEGSRLLGGDISRLTVLASYGVRILTPMWGGLEEAGGAYDVSEGLTDFGRSLISECERQNILVDVSHMSERSFWDTVNIAKKPIIATHSNSKSLCNHPRNLTDIQFRTIAEAGGIVGVSAAAKHISAKYTEASPSDGHRFISEFCDHIEHYLNLDGAKAVCLGCDFDGTEVSVGLSDVSAMYMIRDELLSRNIREGVVDAVMWGNGKRLLGSKE